MEGVQAEKESYYTGMGVAIVVLILALFSGVFFGFNAGHDIGQAKERKANDAAVAEEADLRYADIHAALLNIRERVKAVDGKVDQLRQRGTGSPSGDAGGVGKPPVSE